jgi:hypothetical protein
MPRGGNQIGIVAVAAFPARATEYSSRQLRSPDDGPDHPPTRAVYRLTGMPPRNSGSHQTHCWREMDSNPRSPVEDGAWASFGGATGSSGGPICGSHLTHRWRKMDSNPRSPAIGTTSARRPDPKAPGSPMGGVFDRGVASQRGMCAKRSRCHVYRRPAGYGIAGIGRLEPNSDQAGRAPRWRLLEAR